MGQIDAAAVRRAALHLFAQRGYRATTMADIGAALGVRGPSLYRHVRSKQEVLAEIMTATMQSLLAEQRAAVEAGGDPTVQVRRMVEGHVRFHAANREQAFVGNREIDNLEEAHRTPILKLRRRYARTLRRVIDEGVRRGEFNVANSRLAAFAILDMGMGVASWFHDDGPNDANDIAYAHADFAIALLVARPDQPA